MFFLPELSSVEKDVEVWFWLELGNGMGEVHGPRKSF